MASVNEHYSGGGKVLPAIVAGLEKLGLSPDTATVQDLAPADQFHIGGKKTAMALFGPLAARRRAPAMPTLQSTPPHLVLRPHIS